MKKKNMGISFFDFWIFFILKISQNKIEYNVCNVCRMVGKVLGR